MKYRPHPQALTRAKNEQPVERRRFIVTTVNM